MEVENVIFDKSKSSEEYSTYIRNVILVLARQKNMQTQQAGQMSHQMPLGGAGRGMGVPGMQGGGAGGGGGMMPATMNPRPGMAMNPMAPSNYPYQGGMGPSQGQVAVTMQPRPQAPPQYNSAMYQQPGQMPGMVQQPGRFVGGQPGYTGMQPGANYPPQSLGMMQQPGSYAVGGRYPGSSQIMMSSGAAGMAGMRMPMGIRSQMPTGPMMTNQPMSVPGHMGAPTGPTSYTMDSGVQPVRAIPNPSYPAVRPSGAPQMQSGVPSPYNSALTGSPSQQQAMQGGPASSMPSSIGGATVPGSSAAQPPLPPSSGVSGSDQQQGAAAGGAPGASGPTGQIGNPPTPRPAQSSIRDMPVPSPAPPTPLLPASPATSGIGSPAQQPMMTPEENEAYLRKLNELQRYAPLLNKWITRLSQSHGDNRRNDQYVKLKSLYNLLSNEQRRVPLATLMKCEAALVKMFDQPQSKETNQEPPPSVGGQSQTSSAAGSVAPPTNPAPSSSSQPSSSTPLPITSSTTTTTTAASSSLSSLPPPAEPVVPPVRLADPSKSKSLMDFKMIPSPPPTCGNLLDTIRAKPLPPERVPPAKRLCNRESPSIPPSLLRELAVLDHFKIKLLPKENQFDKSTTLRCSLEDNGLPEVPALTVTIPPNYPSVSPICNLNDYHNNSVPFLKSVGKLLSEKLMRSHWTYSLSLLLTSWEDCVLRAMARELTSLED